MEKLELLTRAFIAAHHPAEAISALVEEHLPTARFVTALSGEQSVFIQTPDGQYLTPATAKYLAEQIPPAPSPVPKTRDERTAEHLAVRRTASTAAAATVSDKPAHEMAAEEYNAARRAAKREGRSFP